MDYHTKKRQQWLRSMQHESKLLAITGAVIFAASIVLFSFI
jgi:hypothetical protein